VLRTAPFPKSSAFLTEIIGDFRGNFRAISEQFRGNFGAISEQFRGNFGAISEQFLGEFRVIFGAISG